jgi:hypothetical protein
MNTLTCGGRGKCNIWLGGTKYRFIHPIEAERLQTLPDNYTDILESDTQRIKAIGNGWTVDVVAYVFKRMVNKLHDITLIPMDKGKTSNFKGDLREAKNE